MKDEEEEEEKTEIDIDRNKRVGVIVFASIYLCIYSLFRCHFEWERSEQ